MNGVGISLNPLADTGANGFLFMNRPLAKNLSRALDVPIRSLPYSVPIRGFKGPIQAYATHYIRLHLTVDGRRIYNCPFVILDLGDQDVIIGIQWMKRFKLKLDTARNRFIWPSEYPPTQNFAKEIVIPYNSRELLIKFPEHQADASRRDRNLELEDIRRRAGAFSIQKITPLFPLNSQKRTPGLLKLPFPISLPVQDTPNITPEVSNSKKGRKRPRKRRRKRQTQVNIQPGAIPASFIFNISANAFHFNMKRPNNEFFTTSLYEIDRLIQDRYDPDLEDTETAQLIKEKLPTKYKEFEDVFSKTESNKLPPRRYYDHKIVLESPLPNSFSPLYRQSTAELEATKKYLQEHLEKGFIEHSKSPFASPILFVKKPDGSLRCCIDYRKLNALTRKDSYAIPRVDELLARVSHAKVFTKLDIRAAFNRIRIDPDSEEYTTFRTRYGSYKCKVMPFGLTNGPATYQRFMNDVLMDYLDDFCMAYLDDILIYSLDPLLHADHVKKVLKRLREAGLQADVKKSEFDVTRTKYLGFIVTTSGVEADPEKVEVIRNWARPTTVTGVRSYLGFCGFYRQFIRDFGLIAKPLTTLTRLTEPFLWTDACTIAFEELRRQLLLIPRIHHFDPALPTKVETDASNGVAAGVFSQQHPDSKWYPVGFYSHVFSGASTNWEIHDKELGAIVLAFKQWRAELQSAQGRIDVFTDHRSLEYFMSTKVLTARQVGWMEFLSGFNFVIRYTAGKDNQKADILSRREQDVAAQALIKLDSRSRVLLSPARLDPRINSELAEVYVNTISAMSSTIAPMDSGLPPILDSFELITELRRVNRESFPDLRSSLPDNYTIKDGLLLYQERLCVVRDTPLCTRLIKEAHAQPSSAHPSGTKTYQLLAPKYYWHGMGADCKRYVRNCRECRQNHTAQSKQQGLLHPLPIPAYPMQHLTMDFKEFPTDKHGFDAILVFMDRLSKESVTIPCHKTTDARGMATLFVQWIYRFGHTPETIVSDRGPQFVSSFWEEFCRIIGVKIKLSTAYHKQTDGQTEIMNRYIDQRLRPFVTYFQDNWSDLLPIIDRAQMTLPHSTIGMAPYKLLFGNDPRNSWDWKTPKASTPLEKLNRRDALEVATRMHNAWKVAKENMEKAQERMSQATNRHRRSIDWEVNDMVYLSTRNLKNFRPSRKLANQWTGPYRILKKVGHAYQLELPPGSQIHDVFSPDVLSKDPNNPLPGQENPKPSGELIDGVEEWEVQDILAVRLVHKSLKYQVSWVGHDPDPVWYPASNFMGSPHKLRDFHGRYPHLPGPPRNLALWLKAWEDGIDDLDHLEDNAPVERQRQ
jgi:transposase InsO family protein